MDCEFSIVVATYKRPDLLQTCLDALIPACRTLSWECLVIGQGDDTETRQVVEERYRDRTEIRYVHRDDVGLAAARDQGARMASGRVVVFVDDDACPEPSWGEGLSAAFPSDDAGVGMATGPLRPIWDGGRPSWYPKEREFLLGLYELDSGIGPLPNGDLPIGANLAIRASVLREIGGFDEELGFSANRRGPLIAGEDSLLGIRTKQMGYELRYHPLMAVRHLVRRDKVRVRYYLERNFGEGATAVALLCKSGNVGRGDLFRAAVVHLGRAVAKSLRAIVPFGARGQGVASRFMLYLAEAAYSLGAVYQVGATLWVKGDASS